MPGKPVQDRPVPSPCRTGGRADIHTKPTRIDPVLQRRGDDMAGCRHLAALVKLCCALQVYEDSAAANVQYLKDVLYPLSPVAGPRPPNFPLA